MAPDRQGVTRRRRLSLTARSLIGLGLGLATGALAHALDSPGFLRALAALDPIGEVWTHALRGVVLPLVLANLVLAIASSHGGRGVGRISALAFGSFMALLAIGAAYTLLVGPPLVGLFRVGPDVLAAFQSGAPEVPPGARAALPSLGGWLVSLVPANPFRSLLEGDLLPLLVFSIPFAFAVTRLETGVREPLVAVVRGVADTMGVMLGWILWFTPFGVFALTAVMMARTGAVGVGAVGWYVALVCGLLIGFLPVLYLVAWVVGRVSPGRFARGVLPGQSLAIATRSSIASLPGLLRGAEEMRLPREIYALVLPLSVSVFKVNRTISSTAKLLFLAHLYGIALGPEALATFLVSVFLLSFASPGVPTSVGSLTTLPAYLAAGIPIEGILVLGAADSIPDIFKTLLNVTGDMTAATTVTRLSGGHGEETAQRLAG